jgi:trk system potassium uptake protein TrkA
MFILIAGGGKLGYYLAKALIQAGQEVVVIEKIQDKVNYINEELGSLAIVGDACDPGVLGDSGAERAEMVVAVTGDDEDNLIICQVAKNRFNVGFAIARVNNPRNEDIFKRLGIDAPVSATNIILTMIEDEIAHKGVMTSLAIKRGGIEIVETRITHESPARGMALRSIRIPSQCTVAMVLRGNETIIPDGDTILKEDDTVIALAKSERFTELRDVLMGPVAAAT